MVATGSLSKTSIMGAKPRRERGPEKPPQGKHSVSASRIRNDAGTRLCSRGAHMSGLPYEVDGKMRVEYMARVRITVAGVIRDGCGFGQGIDRDVGQAHESALKEAETDAMKRALMTFGNPFGLALYDKSRENVGVDTPPPDYQAIHDRLIAGIAKRKTKQLLAEFWEAEVEARITLKANATGLYNLFVSAFKDAGEKAIDDKAGQAPEPEGKAA